MAEDTNVEKPAPRRDSQGQKDADTEALIRRWFADHIHGSAVARYTDAYNVVHTAMEDLISRMSSPRK